MPRRDLWSGSLLVILMLDVTSCDPQLVSTSVDDMVAVHPETRDLYIATRNSVILRSKSNNYTVIANVSLDYSRTNNSHGNSTTQVTAIGIDPSNDNLLACWTKCGGLCALFNSSNITRYDWLVGDETGSYVKTRSAIVFLEDNKILVGSSIIQENQSDPLVKTFKFLSMRKLSKNPLELTFMSEAANSIATINTASNYTIQFLSGFKLNNFVYFTTVQEVPNSLREIKILRLLGDSSSVVPLRAVTLQCLKHNTGKPIDVQYSHDPRYIFVSVGRRVTDPRNAVSFCRYEIAAINKGLTTTAPLGCLNTNASNTCTIPNDECYVQGRSNASCSKVIKPDSYQAKLEPLSSTEKCPDSFIGLTVHSNKTHKVLSRFCGVYTCEVCQTENSTKNPLFWCNGRCKNDANCSNPCIFDGFTPKRGPKSGGTTLTFRGCNLNNPQIEINGVKCDAIPGKTNSSTHMCSLDNKHNQHGENDNQNDPTRKIGVTVNNRQTNCSALGAYDFEEDPKITEIKPTKGYRSGNSTLTIRGSQFDIVQNSIMTLQYNGRNSTFISNHTCTVHNSSVLYCTVPAVNKSLDFPVQALLRFIMDSLLIKELHYFKVYSDPEFDSNEEEQNQSAVNDGDNITFFGKFEGVENNDISCKIANLDSKDVDILANKTIISCQPPWKELSELGIRGNQSVILAIKDSKSKTIWVFLKTEDKEKTPFLYQLPSYIINIIIGVAIVVASAFGILVFVACFKCFKYNTKAYHARLASSVYASTSYDDRALHAYFELQPRYQQRLSKDTIQQILDSKLMIPEDQLKLGEAIGSGNFGCVYIGDLYMDRDKETSARVAVKTIHDGNQSLDLKSFVEEALIMKEFHHKNILQLLGISVNEDHRPMVVLPFMANGDLFSYITNDQKRMTICNVIAWGIDIAEGMSYLAQLKVVHRDLAARNCMLDDKLSVKVADFGLSRDIYEQGMYTSDNKKKLPIRWMAPESMDRGVYSTKSDVWSLGVVLWELLTRGATPYPGVEGWDISLYLRQGRRLPQPWFCSGTLYDIMLEMWSLDPNQRPSCSEISEMLTSLLQTSTEEDVTSENMDGDYVTFPACCQYIHVPGSDYFVLEPEADKQVPDEDNAVNELV